jgi:Tfp pilus assembly protein PilN
MKHKTTDITINLVPKDPFFATAVGRSLQWALTAGRYIVIFTEIIVILSFAARFTLDRQVSDLNKQLLSKDQVIGSYGELEKNFRLAQAQIAEYSKINQETNLSDVFANLTEVTPPDVVISSLSITPTAVSIQASTFSQTSFNTFINNLQISPDFLNVSVGSIEAKEANSSGLSFTISADTRVIKKVVKAAAEEDKVEILDRTQGL